MCLRKCSSVLGARERVLESVSSCEHVCVWVYMCSSVCSSLPSFNSWVQKAQTFLLTRVSNEQTIKISQIKNSKRLPEVELFFESGCSNVFKTVDATLWKWLLWEWFAIFMKHSLAPFFMPTYRCWKRLQPIDRKMFLRIAFYFWDEQSFIGTYRITKGKAALSAMREIIRAGQV